MAVLPKRHAAPVVLLAMRANGCCVRLCQEIHQAMPLTLEELQEIQVRLCAVCSPCGCKCAPQRGRTTYHVL